MNKILFVEDSKMFGTVIQKDIEAKSDFEVVWAQSFVEAENLIGKYQEEFFVSLLDLNLPDAPEGEIVDFVLSKNIPVIIFTSDISDEARESFWSKHVVDYVLKEGAQSVDYIIAQINRIHRNKDIPVLVVDDSPLFRKACCDLLTVHQYTVFDVEDGVAAMNLFEKNCGIKLVITDCNMPNMNGLDLTINIRNVYNSDEVAVIGLSDQDSTILSAKFIKNGANDFLAKPFTNEEFYCRVNHTVTMLENVQRINAMMETLAHKNKELENALAQLKESQSQTLQREKMASIGQLAAGVAHEINNPMGFISSNLGTMGKYVAKLQEYIIGQDDILAEVNALDRVQELRKTLKVDFVMEDMGDLVKESVEGAVRVKDIVMGLKNFSRVDQAEYKMVNVNDCIEGTLNVIWNELKYKTVVSKEYGDLPATKCYPQQLNQVFMNLLINAAQAIKKEGNIIIRTWSQDETVYVAISDTGCGIPEENMNRLFEPFYTTKDVGEGTGLGLSIAYDIIKKHDAEIAVKSEVGKGTTFTISFPVKSE